MPGNVPPEILSRFVLHLDPDDEDGLEALKTLAITSSVFLQPCRSVIFHHIKLDDWRNHTNMNAPSPGEKLLNLVNSSPWVAKYVKKISIFDVLYASWLSNDLKVAQALNKLNLEQIEHFVLHRGYRTKWLMLPAEIKAVIMKVLQSPALVNLSVRRTPMALLGIVQPTLKHLELLETVANSDEYIKPVPRDSPLVIRTLHIQHAHDLSGNIQWLVDRANPVKVDALEKLSLVATNDEDCRHIPMLLEACKTSLKTFEFEPFAQVCQSSPEPSSLTHQYYLLTQRAANPRSHFFDIAACTALDTLSVTVGVAVANFEGDRNCLEWTSNFISSISKSNLTRIHLLLEWDLSDAPGDIENTTDSRFFNGLAHYLRILGIAACNSQKYPCIRSLDVEIKSTNPVHDDTPHIIRLVNRSFERIPRPDLVKLSALPHETALPPQTTATSDGGGLPPQRSTIMGSIFPLEILSRVVHSLSEDEDEDIQTLRTLAITSSAFLQPCRSIIFHHIRLNDFRQSRLQPGSNDRSPGEKILNLVNSSPWVAKYVKKITIQDAFYTSWLDNDLKVAEALNKLELQQIQCFVLHRGHMSSWSRLAPEIKAVIVRICQSPALIRLNLIRIPLSLLGAVSPTLEHLEVLDTDKDSNIEEIKPASRGQCLSLRTLCIRDFHALNEAVKWLTNGANIDLRLNALEELEVFADNEGHHSCAEVLLEACGKQSLKTFTFSPYGAMCQSLP
ncbi:hypothetical protein MD484_g4539, partial [Candolleomyces efflorescens]